MIIGIDLGTSNSMASVYRDGEVHLIDNGMGGVVTPSVVALDENGIFHAGEYAREKRISNPKSTSDKFKRSMGTAEDFEIGSIKMKAEELSAVVLKKLKEDAERFLKEEVTDAIISVPAFFNNLQREAVLKAGKLAGLNVRKIINEPTAAAMAYGMQNIEDEAERAIIVLDLGGGTFDISIMEIAGSVMEVVAICGDNHLGGNDFTDKLYEAFITKNAIDLELSSKESANLWKEAEKAKISISETGKASMKCSVASKNYSLDITEAEYEKMCYELLNRIRTLTLRAIDESKYLPKEISDIILVGGGTKLSLVKRMMEKMLDKELAYYINPDEAVVRGAAMQGALMEQNEELKDLVMTDICPYYIMTKGLTWDGADIRREDDMMITKNTIIPTKTVQKRREKPGDKNIKIYQSEDKYGINSTLIGTCKYIVPTVKEDYADTIHTIMYDNNGILIYEVYTADTDKTYSTAINNNGDFVDMGNIKSRMEELNLLTVSNGEADANALIIAKAEKLYTELLGKDRERLSDAISDFEASLKTNKKSVIAEAKKRLEEFLE